MVLCLTQEIIQTETHGKIDHSQTTTSDHVTQSKHKHVGRPILVIKSSTAMGSHTQSKEADDLSAQSVTETAHTDTLQSDHTLIQVSSKNAFFK